MPSETLSDALKAHREALQQLLSDWAKQQEPFWANLSRHFLLVILAVFRDLFEGITARFRFSRRLQRVREVRVASAHSESPGGLPAKFLTAL